MSDGILVCGRVHLSSKIKPPDLHISGTTVSIRLTNPATGPTDDFNQLLLQLLEPTSICEMKLFV